MSINQQFTTELRDAIEQLKTDRVYKRLNHLDSPQSAWVTMEGRGRVLILSSNNYAGLCDEPDVIAAGKAALDRCGAGTNRRRCSQLIATADNASLTLSALGSRRHLWAGCRVAENVVCAKEINGPGP